MNKDIRAAMLGDYISEGMQAEIRQAEALGIAVRYVRGGRA